MSIWNSKNVLVSGGSQGLGLEIARTFSAKGANITLVARNAARLDEAEKTLAAEGGRVQTRSCDVTDWESVQACFQELRQTSGPIDVLVNAVGKSTRSNIEELDLDEIHRMMDLNFYSAVHCVKAALPDLISKQGHIVNIGSLSSKTAWPFMTPYTTSKFALAALTHQLRVELGQQVHSMLVCPGPIKREDAGVRYDAEAKNLPDAARKPGGGAKIKGICPKKLADKIVWGCEKKKAEIIIPWKAKLLFMCAAFSTRLGDWLIRKNKS